MPIRPEKLVLYSPDWPQIRAEVLDRARNAYATRREGKALGDLFEQPT